MTSEQINLIQRNFAAIAPAAEEFATVFYNHLFNIEPVLRLLFPTDMKEQKKKLMTTLALAVKTLSDAEKLVPVLEDLGRRHALYGVRKHHYETVGAALLETLRGALGTDFTVEAQDAWTKMYGFVAETMQRAAHAMEANLQSDVFEKPLKIKRVPTPSDEIVAL